MKKKLLIFFIFLSFFFVKPQPVLAANFFKEVWNWITSKLIWFLHTETVRYTSNESPLTINKKEIFTTYDNKYNSLSDRSTPESFRKYRRGIYLYEILTKAKAVDGTLKYPDSIFPSTDNCPNEISTNDITCFFYHQYQSNPSLEKILYTRDDPKVPIDYPEDLSEICTKTLENPAECYINAYINLQDIPHGKFLDEEDSAVISSTQANDSIVTLLPDLSQGEDRPTTNDSHEQIETLILNTDEKEEKSLRTIVNQNDQKNIPCDPVDPAKNREYLRDYRDRELLPASWQKPKQSNSSLNVETFQNLPDPSCHKDGHGRGMSQYGAQGMALSGYNYHQILNAYYGDETNTGIYFKIFDEDEGYTNKMITVDLVDSCNNNLDCGPKKYSKCLNLEGVSVIGKIQAPESQRSEAKIPLTESECQQEENDLGKTYQDQNCLQITEQVNGNTVTKIIAKPGSKLTDTECNDSEFGTKLWEQSCTYRISISLDDYLLGLNEIDPNDWNLETHKAQTVAARTIAYSKSNGFKDPVSNSSANIQSFRCAKIIYNKIDKNTLNPDSNQATAVAATSNEFMMINGEVAPSTEYSSIHCGPSLNWTFFDGLNFEIIALKGEGIGIASGISIDGICYTNVNSPVTTSTSGSSEIHVSGSVIDGLFHFNDSYVRPDHRIGVDYDLANVDEGKWLQSFPGYYCQLDSRIFSFLQQMIDEAKSAVPDNFLKPYSCYRSIAKQQELWNDKVEELNGNESEAAKWVARPGTSAHHTGRAIDFHDKNGKLKPESSIYQWLLQNGNRFGFYNYQEEEWHWEYNP